MKQKLMSLLSTISPSKEFTEIEGPRPLAASTRDFQIMLWKILDEESGIRFSHNHAGELGATWVQENKEIKINVSSTLEQVDLEQIALSESDYEKYLDFLKTKSKLMPKGRGIYSLLEKSGDSKLHLSEKLAINAYTKSSYKEINEFLRKSGRISASIFNGLSEPHFQLKVKDLLCVITFVTAGINKIVDDDKNLGFRAMILNSEKEDFFVSQLQAIEEKTPSREKAFLSASDSSQEVRFGMKFEPNFFILLTRGGKKIKDYSSTPREEEVLIAPGTRIKYHIYKKEDKQHLMVAQPVLGILPADDKIANVSGEKSYLNEFKKHFTPSPLAASLSKIFESKDTPESLKVTKIESSNLSN